MQSVEDKIVARIYRKGRGFCFSAIDFTDIGSRAAVDRGLMILGRKGIIRRVARGLYDYPRINERLGGQLGPDINAIANAIARKAGSRIQPSGALAANLLGLSEQVPAKHIYLTNGSTRSIHVAGQTIEFKRVPPKELQEGHDISVIVAAALRWLGRGAVDDNVISVLKRHLDKRSRKRLLKDLRFTEAWIFEVAKRLAEEIQ